MSSVQQSSTSFSSHQQSSNEMYESQEFNGGVMKGYKRKDDMSSNEMRVTNTNGRDSAIFGGINGDANSFVADECDYKKHTVKDLANHFALVKPKQNIPHNILPEQRMFNGDQAPQLNYLGANEAGAMVQSQTARREVSQQDIEASKMAYEMKKKQQQEAAQQQSSTTTTSSSTSSSSVVRRTETSSSSTEQKSERRMSLRDSLMLDPAKAHSDMGLIDPSAILRGEAATQWPVATPTSHNPPPHGDMSPPRPLYKAPPPSRSDPHNRSFAPVKFSTLPRPAPSSSQHHSSTLPPRPQPAPMKATTVSSKAQSSSSITTDVGASSVLQPHPDPEYQATVQTSSKSFPSASAPATATTTTPVLVKDAPLIVLDDTCLEADSSHTSTSTVQHTQHQNHSVIHTMLRHSHTDQGATSTTGHPDTELAVSLAAPDPGSRSSAPTPAPTTPFPSLDLLASTRPRTPILVTTRPSSVCLQDRTRHVSKEDLAKMMAELNAPLPPMLDIPSEIRASPLIFSGGLAGPHPHPSHPHPAHPPLAPAPCPSSPATH